MVDGGALILEGVVVCGWAIAESSYVDRAVPAEEGGGDSVAEFGGGGRGRGRVSL